MEMENGKVVILMVRRLLFLVKNGNGKWKNMYFDRQVTSLKLIFTHMYLTAAAAADCGN